MIRQGQVAGTAKTEETKELEIFTNPKIVKKYDKKKLFMLQLKLCGGFTAFLILLKLLVPQVYENVSIYINGFISC